jgi:hypothetical protein
MRPRIRPVIAALVLLLCQEVASQAIAKVVRDGKATQSNQAVESGGYRPPPQQSPPDPPYSLVGAIASQGNWLSQCALWPWRMIGSLSFRHRREPAFMVHSLPPERRPFNWVPPP